jgi:tetratricopeptide (TPR) repeat protein
MVMIALCVGAGLIAGGVYLYRKNRPCLFWYALFFLGLLPVSQIVPLATMMNDRYLYFPMLGVAGLAAHLSGFFREQAGMKPWGRTVLVASAGIVISLSVASLMRSRVWRNSISLFSDAVAKYPNQTNTWSRLAEGYVAAGDLAIAQYYYENADRFGPLDADARHNLARIYLIAGEYDKAYQQIWWLLLRGDQDRVNLVLLGEYYYRTRSYPEAEQYLTSYLEEYPGDTHALYLLGRVFYMTGNFVQAREYYARAVLEDGSSPEIFYGIACLESLEGHAEQSQAALKTAFEKGLSSKNLHEDERCLAGMQNDPRIQPMIRQAAGE